MSVIGYGRCSTAERASNSVSLEIQRRAVERAGESNGWDLTWIADDEYPVPPESRKRFKAALALLEAGDSGALIFTDKERDQANGAAGGVPGRAHLVDLGSSGQPS